MANQFGDPVKFRQAVDMGLAARARLQEQFSPTPAGYPIGKSFSEVADRTVRSREEGSPAEIAESGLNYAGGAVNRTAVRMAGENEAAVAQLGLNAGRSFYDAANDPKNPNKKGLGDFANQLMQFNSAFGGMA